jgi:hypothetical protein
MAVRLRTRGTTPRGKALALRAEFKISTFMALPPRFSEALTLLGQVFKEYQTLSGARAILVGGAAVCFFTAGAYLSGDLDVLVVADDVFDFAMKHHGFRKEDRHGHILRGYYHPAYPEYGVDSVSGSLFDGNADPTKLRVVVLAPDNKLNLASVEDLIADRPGQYAASNNRDKGLLSQAKLLKRLGGRLDTTYLTKRVADEGGDLKLIA